MTNSTEILVDAVSRIKETSASAARGLTLEQVETRIDPEANTIAWLLWHIGRVQDAQVADAAGETQLWLTDGWADRFDLPFSKTATGYGHSAHDVAAVRGVSSELLVDYIAAVCDRTSEYLRSLGDDDLDRVVDEHWNPPVTLAVRLVSVISDDLQHAGQAAFIRGVVTRQS
jgi:hypothetical protein